MTIPLAFTEIIFVARIVNSTCLGSTRSIPPQHMMLLSFYVLSKIRGPCEIIGGHPVNYLANEETIPTFDSEVDYVAGVNRLNQVPIGWLHDSGTFISPFQCGSLRPKWYSAQEHSDKIKCTKTGRPVLQCPDGISLHVQQIIDTDAKDKMAPFGDGKFEISITNTLDREVTIPALLNKDGKVIWEDSLVLLDISFGRAWAFPGNGREDNLQPTILKKGESLKTITNVLTIEGSNEWKIGGTRVYLSFCLGNVCRQNFFYYNSKAHEIIHKDFVGKSAFEDV
ncbi:hypothetical protein ACOME3_003892 [Neoechinorhynchus agilis]